MHLQLLYYYFDILTFGRNLFRENIKREIIVTKQFGSEEFFTSNFPSYTHLSGFGFNQEYLLNASFLFPLSSQFYLSIIGPLVKGSRNKISYRGVNNQVVEYLNYLTFKGANGELFSSNLEQLKRYECTKYVEKMEKEYMKNNTMMSLDEWSNEVNIVY